jgi:hypothetical protein
MAPRIVLPLLLSLLPACRGGGDKSDEDDDGTTTEPEPTPADVRIEGEIPDAGFGAAVALGAGGAWASAPFGDPARVFSLDPEAGASLLFESEGRAGVALAVDPDRGLLVGAPLRGDGAVLDAAGAIVLEGGGVGRAIAAGPVALDAAGWRDGAGGGAPAADRPTSIAAAAGVVALGFAHGNQSALLGDVAVARAHPSEGFSLAGGDLDGDGRPEWALGAPQAGVVRVLDSAGAPIAELTGGGRFGAALAMADIDGDGRAELLVGAPRASGDAGEAVLYSSELEELRRVTGQAADRLGTSVALDAAGLLLGAPGGPVATGAVVWTQP